MRGILLSPPLLPGPREGSGADPHFLLGLYQSWHGAENSLDSRFTA